MLKELTAKFKLSNENPALNINDEKTNIFLSEFIDDTKEKY